MRCCGGRGEALRRVRRFLRAELATSFSKLLPAPFYCQKRRLVTILMSYRLPWHACGRREPTFTHDKHAHGPRHLLRKPACTAIMDLRGTYTIPDVKHVHRPTVTVVTMADVCYAPLQPCKSSQIVPNPNYAISNPRRSNGAWSMRLLTPYSTQDARPSLKLQPHTHSTKA